MTTRKYSSRSQQSTLTGSVTSGATSITVVSGTGLLGGVTIPAGTTFTLVIDPDTALEEIVDATAVSTNTFTITRAIDGSSAQDHSAGAVVRHMAIGRDYREANTHIETSTGVHGIAAGSSVVGTTDTQILTNKTLTAPTITGLSNPTNGGDAANKTYVDAILGSATAAATSAAAAATSATSAATSATSSATSASSSATSATASASSATAAATSATSAATSATSSATSASSSATSATSSATSATSSATSATSSATSASAAATSATSAAASATAAASSATAAAASAASVDATATAATELRQYAAEDSILPNLPARVPVAEGLLKQAAYWVDATNNAYIPTTASGYMYLPGVAANYASAPDSSALDITGDIDIRARVGMDDWGTTQILVAKWTATGNQRSFIFSIFENSLRLQTSPDGINQIVTTSTVPLSYVLGTIKWVRVALDVDNGASGHNVQFFTSDNGTTWTQLGTTITTAGATSIFNSTAVLEVGSANAGTLSLARGKFYRAQVLNGIGGTTVFDANFETAMTSQTVASFTESSTNSATVTINRNTYNFQLDTLSNLGWTGNLLPTTLGSSTAADSNDPKFLDWTGTNYVYLPGVNSNFLSVPDSANLRITGDLDLRFQVAMDDWTPSAIQYFGGKYAAADRGWALQLDIAGNITLTWSPDGTTTNLTATSTVTTGITDGTTKWIRATLDVDNGASGRDIKFFTSDNGTSWTQLGTTITQAGTTSIFASTQAVTIGTYSSGALATNVISGKVFRAQIFDGIDGTKVLDVDTSVITSGAATSFYALSGQTVTINRATSGRKTVAVVHPCWLFGTDDYMEVNNRYLSHAASSENYVYLNGDSGNYLSTPDANVLDITSDIDIRVKAALDDWTPSAAQALIAKYNTTGNQRSWRLEVGTTGNLAYVWSADGTTPITVNSSVAPTITDGATKWIRVTHDVDNGASGNDVKFYTSDDGTTWTQLGTTQTTAGTTSIYASTAIQEIGSYNTGAANLAKGKFYRAQVYNGIAGTLVFDADASVITDGTASTFKERSSNAATVTINKSGTGTFASTNNYLYLPGVAGNYASAPDSAAVSITGDIDLRCKVAMDDWTPSGISGLVSKYLGNQVSYSLYLNTNGILSFVWSTNGTSQIQKDSTVVNGITDGATKWIRVTLDVDNGASGNDVKFYTSDDGITWTQLGSTVTTAGTTSIYDSTALVEVGSVSSGTLLPARGKFYRAMVLNGIGGTVAFDANFESSITSNLPTTITEASTNAATVTINYSGTAYRSAGVTQSTYVYPGGTNIFKPSSVDYLNFGASDSFTIIAVTRDFGTDAAGKAYLAKKFGESGAATAGYLLWRYETDTYAQISDSSVFPGNINRSNNTIRPNLSIATFIRNVSADTISLQLNTQASTSRTDTTTSTLSNVLALRIGGNSSGGAFGDFELIGAAIFRRALTDAEIASIITYYAGRVGA